MQLLYFYRVKRKKIVWRHKAIQEYLHIATVFRNFIQGVVGESTREDIKNFLKISKNVLSSIKIQHIGNYFRHWLIYYRHWPRYEYNLKNNWTEFAFIIIIRYTCVCTWIDF